ncbi:sulfurtransferase [Desulfolithobacter dissulfuricans]|uniref:Sulfurtransferase n=1 Tax=Desulfolithobacter dissulfuricans TaxID=2795293 RepID=A0A915U398_9BACT|nr:rhodanese-like domain-containing protein [Desulfolithobacter dissulfuricans]BCO10576.1 sulfurtransferase [Desulfolithobacter dissulfuricans]
MKRAYQQKTSFLGVLLCIFFLPGLVMAAGSSLVSVEWLAKNLNKKNLVILDVSEFIHYESKHIPGAVKAFGPWMTMNSEFVGFMMPDETELVSMLRGYGVNNDSFVVVYDEGITSRDTAKSARALWTLHALGHDQVAILDGGMAAWEQSEQPVTTRAATPFGGNFSGKLQASKIATLAEVKAKLGSGKVTFLDNRSPDQYFGHEKNSEISRAGHLPGSLLWPESFMTIAGVDFAPSYFRDKDELEKMARGVYLPADKKAEIITYSNHGLAASMGYFVLHDLLGYRNVKVFDGSILEVAPAEDVPMVVQRWGWEKM